jgi:hypothetical protein
MNAFVAFLSPLALLLPAMVGELPASRGDLSAHEAAERTDAGRGFDTLPSGPLEGLRDARQSRPYGQVRIEQRVIIRISPGTSQVREQMMADQRRQSQAATSYQWERLDGCIAVSNIVGMEPSPEQNRLLLFMRDRRVLGAALERACNVRDYYSGFYIARHEDGQLCARRDLLQSRSGASCKAAQLSRLVVVRD